MADQGFPGYPPPAHGTNAINTVSDSVSTNSFFGPPQPGNDLFSEITSNQQGVILGEVRAPLEQNPTGHGPSPAYSSPVGPTSSGNVSHNPSVLVPSGESQSSLLQRNFEATAPQQVSFQHLQSAPATKIPPSTIPSASVLFGSGGDAMATEDDFFSSLQPSQATAFISSDQPHQNLPVQQGPPVPQAPIPQDQVPFSVGSERRLSMPYDRESATSMGGPVSLPTFMSSSANEPFIEPPSQQSSKKSTSAPSTGLIQHLTTLDALQTKSVADDSLSKQHVITNAAQVTGLGISDENITEPTPLIFSNSSSALSSPMTRPPSNADRNAASLQPVDAAFPYRTNADPEYSSNISGGSRGGPKRPLTNLESDLDPAKVTSNLSQAEKFSLPNVPPNLAGTNLQDYKNISTLSNASADGERAPSLNSSYNQSSLCSLLDSQEEFSFRSSPIRLVAPAPYNILGAENTSTSVTGAPGRDDNTPSLPPLSQPSTVDTRKCAQTLAPVSGPLQNQSQSVIPPPMASSISPTLTAEVQGSLPMIPSTSSAVSERLMDAIVSQEDDGQLRHYSAMSLSTDALAPDLRPQGSLVAISSRSGSERPDSLEDWEIVDHSNAGSNQQVHSNTSDGLLAVSGPPQYGGSSPSFSALSEVGKSEYSQQSSPQGLGYPRESVETSQVQHLSSSDTSTLVASSPPLPLTAVSEGVLDGATVSGSVYPQPVQSEALGSITNQPSSELAATYSDGSGFNPTHEMSLVFSTDQPLMQQSASESSLGRPFAGSGYDTVTVPSDSCPPTGLSSQDSGPMDSLSVSAGIGHDIGTGSITPSVPPVIQSNVGQVPPLPPVCRVSSVQAVVDLYPSTVHSSFPLSHQANVTSVPPMCSMQSSAPPHPPPAETTLQDHPAPVPAPTAQSIGGMEMTSGGEVLHSQNLGLNHDSAPETTYTSVPPGGLSNSQFRGSILNGDAISAPPTFHPVPPETHKVDNLLPGMDRLHLGPSPRGTVASSQSFASFGAVSSDDPLNQVPPLTMPVAPPTEAPPTAFSALPSGISQATSIDRFRLEQDIGTQTSDTNLHLPPGSAADGQGRPLSSTTISDDQTLSTNVATHSTISTAMPSSVAMVSSLPTMAPPSSVPILAPSSSTMVPAPPSSTMVPAPPSSTMVPAPPSSTMVPAPPSSTMVPAPPSSTMVPAPPSSTMVSAPPSSTMVPALPSSTMVPALPSSTMVPALPSSTMVSAPPSSTMVPAPPSSTMVPAPPSSTIVLAPPSSSTVPAPPSSETVPPPSIMTASTMPPIPTTTTAPFSNIAGNHQAGSATTGAMTSVSAVVNSQAPPSQLVQSQVNPPPVVSQSYREPSRSGQDPAARVSSGYSHGGQQQPYPDHTQSFYSRPQSRASYGYPDQAHPPPNPHHQDYGPYYQGQPRYDPYYGPHFDDPYRHPPPQDPHQYDPYGYNMHQQHGYYQGYPHDPRYGFPPPPPHLRYPHPYGHDPYYLGDAYGGGQYPPNPHDPYFQSQVDPYHPHQPYTVDPQSQAAAPNESENLLEPSVIQGESGGGFEISQIYPSPNAPGGGRPSIQPLESTALEQNTNNTPLAAPRSSQLRGIAEDPAAYYDRNQAGYPGESYPSEVANYPQDEYNTNTANQTLESNTEMQEIWEPVTIAPPSPERMTPYRYHCPHVRASFGFGGQLVTVLPTGVGDENIGRVEFHSVESLLNDNESQNFIKEVSDTTGPFIPGETPKSSVFSFSSRKVEECQDDEDLSDNEDERMLWEFLKLLCQQNGVIVPSDVADLLIEGRTLAIKAGPPQNMEECMDTLRQLLFSGRKKNALEYACSKGMWGHALMLASRMDDPSRNYVVNRFTASLPSVDPLSTFYTLLLGRTPAAVKQDGLVRAGDWRPHLSMILANKNSKLDTESIISLGDSLLSTGRVYAAHLCYYLADVHFGLYGDSSSKYSLLGVDQSVNKVGWYPLPQQLVKMEVLEYAMSLSRQEVSFPSFQLFKLLYVLKLVEFGFVEKAVKYCEQISHTVLKRIDRYMPTMLSILLDMSLRLHHFTTEYGVVAGGELPSWLKQLERSITSILSTDYSPHLTSPSPAFSSVSQTYSSGGGAREVRPQLTIGLQQDAESQYLTVPSHHTTTTTSHAPQLEERGATYATTQQSEGGSRRELVTLGGGGDADVAQVASSGITLAAPLGYGEEHTRQDVGGAGEVAEQHQQQLQQQHQDQQQQLQQSHLQSGFGNFDQQLQHQVQQTTSEAANENMTNPYNDQLLAPGQQGASSEFAQGGGVTTPYQSQAGNQFQQSQGPPQSMAEMQGFNGQNFDQGYGGDGQGSSTNLQAAVSSQVGNDQYGQSSMYGGHPATSGPSNPMSYASPPQNQEMSRGAGAGSGGQLIGQNVEGPQQSNFGSGYYQPPPPTTAGAYNFSASPDEPPPTTTTAGPPSTTPAYDWGQSGGASVTKEATPSGDSEATDHKSEDSSGTSGNKESSAPKKPAKDEKPPAKSGSGWGFLGWIIPKKKNEVILPDDKEPSIVWDEEKKAWVNLDQDDEDKEDLAPPPSDDQLGGGQPSFPAPQGGVAGTEPTATQPASSNQVPGQSQGNKEGSEAAPKGPNMYSIQGRNRRGARSKYIDVMNKGGSGTSSALPPPGPPLMGTAPSASTAFTGSFFVPTAVEGGDSTLPFGVEATLSAPDSESAQATQNTQSTSADTQQSQPNLEQEQRHPQPPPQEQQWEQQNQPQGQYHQQHHQQQPQQQQQQDHQQQQQKQQQWEQQDLQQNQGQHQQQYQQQHYQQVAASGQVPPGRSQQHYVEGGGGNPQGAAMTASSYQGRPQAQQKPPVSQTQPQMDYYSHQQKLTYGVQSDSSVPDSQQQAPPPPQFFNPGSFDPVGSIPGSSESQDDAVSTTSLVSETSQEVSRYMTNTGMASSYRQPARRGRAYPSRSMVEGAGHTHRMPGPSQGIPSM